MATILELIGHFLLPNRNTLRLQFDAGRGQLFVGSSTSDHAVAGRGMPFSFDRSYRFLWLGYGPMGNTFELRYDVFGKLIEVVDDLGRRYQFEYYDDPNARDAEEAKKYGLLRSLKDFADREVVYDYDENRVLESVQLPEVGNEVGAYSAYSYQGA